MSFLSELFSSTPSKGVIVSDTPFGPPLPKPETSFFSGFADTFSKIADSASSAFTSFTQAQSNVRNAKLAGDLEKLKIQTIKQNVGNAPSAFKAALPSFDTFIKNPKEASRQTTPIVLAGASSPSFSPELSGNSTLTMAAVAIIALGGLFLLKR